MIAEPPSFAGAVHVSPILSPVSEFGISVIAPGASGKPARRYDDLLLGVPSIGLSPVT